MQKDRNKMGTMPMPGLILNMSLPLMFSLLIQSLYNIVDSIFVARLGQNALTAVSLAYPMQILMIAVSVGTSVGINALLSRSIGAGETGLTGRAAATGVLLALAGTVVFCAAPEPLLRLFNASEEMLALGVPALRVISLTFVFAAVTVILGYACSGLGSGVINMVGTALRQVVLLVPLVWLLARTLGIGWAWYAFWVAEPAAALYAGRAALRLLKARGMRGRKEAE